MNDGCLARCDTQAGGNE